MNYNGGYFDSATDKSGKPTSEKVGLLTSQEVEEPQKGFKKKEIEMTSADAWSAEKKPTSPRKQLKSPFSSKPSSPTEVQPEEAMAFAKTPGRLHSYSSLNGEGNGSTNEGRLASSSPTQPATKSEGTKPETKPPPPRPMLPSTVQRGTQLIIVQEVS